MRMRLWMCALALSVALPAAAQDTTRAARPTAQRRVLVSKGEVVPMVRVDTVVVLRTDTVYATRIDRMMVRDTIVRVDTVMVPVPAVMPVEEARGTLYGGFYTGMTMPSGRVDRMYTNGFHAGALFGWDGMSQLLGLQLNTSISQLSREQGQLASVVGTVTPLLASFGADVKVMPLRRPDWQLYGVGGASMHSYRGIAMVADQGTPDGRGGFVRPAGDNGWHQKFGFSVGGGLDFLLGGQELFLEGRAMAIQAHGERTWFVPVSLGLRYF